MSTEKEALRQKLLEVRSSLDKRVWFNYSQVIQNRLCQSMEWQQANTIAFYLPLVGEVSTLHALTYALEQNKNVAAPVINPQTTQMSFKQFGDLDELVEGPFRLLQPINGTLLAPDQLDLIIVPGVGFDNKCNRLGFGKGYYDHYLAGYKGTTIALAFEIQLVEQLVTSESDQPVDKIITEKRILKK